MAPLLRALRPKQWTKNAVVLAAFIFALGDRQQQVGISAFWTVLEAALLFCVISSGVYLMNDIRDIEQDRLHPNKKLRPLAAGQISMGTAWTASVVLIAAGLAASTLINIRLFEVLLLYVALQVAYTFFLKNVVLIDLFMIAIGFVLRALAGAVAISAAISPWLLLCTLLLALFLALCKRRHEKVILSEWAGETRKNLDQYDEKLLDQLIAIVSASTIISYSLYTLWPDTIVKFGTSRLSLTIPFVIFGVFRYLDLVYRHEKGDRPEHILLPDIPLLIDLARDGLTVAGVLIF
ncbi:MAG: decaprenyl-phosphate phosphoribosyltransferase [Lentisphaerota bacterium]